MALYMCVMIYYYAMHIARYTCTLICVVNYKKQLAASVASCIVLYVHSYAIMIIA